MTRKKPNSRSGTAFTEADYAARGYRTLKLRLPAEDGALLDELCESHALKPGKLFGVALRALAKSANRKR